MSISSQTGSLPSPNSTLSDTPPGPENTKLDKQSSDIPPSKLTNIPSPSGITAPANENPNTVVGLEVTVKPFAAASPPLAPTTQPS